MDLRFGTGMGAVGVFCGLGRGTPGGGRGWPRPITSGRWDTTGSGFSSPLRRCKAFHPHCLAFAAAFATAASVNFLASAEPADDEVSRLESRPNPPKDPKDLVDWASEIEVPLILAGLGGRGED